MFMSIVLPGIELLEWKLDFTSIGHHRSTVASGDSRAKIVSLDNHTFAELHS